VGAALACDQIQRGAVEQEEPLQLGPAQVADEPLVRGHLVVGQELHGHSGTTYVDSTRPRCPNPAKIVAIANGCTGLPQPRCRAERIEPPAAGRIDRIVRSALHQGEQALTTRLAARLPVDVAARFHALVAVEVPDDDAGEESVLALIKSVPGNVSLESMLTEIRKLRAVRAIGHRG
jgi:hypothetical protein